MLVAPDAQTRQELLSTLTLALHGMTPALSDKAFTASSTLLIDRVTLRDSSGIHIDGRRRSATVTFTLQMRASPVPAGPSTDEPPVVVAARPLRAPMTRALTSLRHRPV